MRRVIYIASNVTNRLVRLPDHAGALGNIDFTNPRIVVRVEAER